MRRVIVSFLGSGYLRPFPGTWGTGAATVVYGAMYVALVRHANISWLAFNVLIAVLTLAGTVAAIVCGRWAETHFGKKDPGPFVLDEAVGYWLAMLALPLAGAQNRVLTAMAIQFVLFRIVDVVKPPPAQQAQQLPHGWGIVVDDLVAGLYCNLIAQVLFRTVLA